MKQWLKNDRGQAVAETALMIPLLIFILMGVFVVGYWLYVKQVTVAAAREGARVGAQTGSKSSAEAAALDVMKAVYDVNKGSPPTVTTDDPPPFPNPSSTSALTVRVRYTIPLLSQYFKDEYEKKPDGSLRPWWFGAVDEMSVARLEVDFTNP